MRKAKRHGLTCPFHPLQVSSWMMVAYSTAVISIIILPLFPDSLQPGFAASIGVVSASLFLSALLTTWVDPTDPMVRSSQGVEEPSEYRAFCSLCNCRVSLTAKHCGQCNRCVDHFDHHCKWLNNCIGGRNYLLFLWTVVSMQAYSGLVTAFAAITLFHATNEADDFAQRLDGVYSTSQKDVLLGLISFLLALNALIFLGNGHLLCFHIWLRFKGLTTYEYIQGHKKTKTGLFVRPETLETPPQIPEVAGNLRKETDDLRILISAGNTLETRRALQLP